MKRILIAALLIAAPAHAQISQPDVGKAQGAMLTRVQKSVDRFLTAYKLDSMYAGYCRIQMALDTRHEADGSIPFGVNYLEIKDRDTLNIVISAREVYETAYLKLCLSKALKTLDAVNPFEKFDSLEK